MFTGLNQEVCAQAWDVIVPAIEKAAELGVTNGLCGTLIVLDPANPDPKNPLFMATIGDEDPQLLINVEGKVAVTIRTGLDSSRVGQDFPYLYKAGDIKYPGAIIREGLIVSFSGVQGDYDEMICEWMVAALRGICRQGFNGEGGANRQPGAYLAG
ncbi:hypothetical protein [Demequina oxidasica]|uniref:hypothetical protein n=1 Tax=Demequina oxidasica TaxID=676199 RepID=UPI000785DF9A|nr:hypothetical protein [Demequina oxidasica]